MEKVRVGFGRLRAAPSSSPWQARPQPRSRLPWLLDGTALARPRASGGLFQWPLRDRERESAKGAKTRSRTKGFAAAPANVEGARRDAVHALRGAPTPESTARDLTSYLCVLGVRFSLARGSTYDHRHGGRRHAAGNRRGPRAVGRGRL